MTLDGLIDKLPDGATPEAWVNLYKQVPLGIAGVLVGAGLLVLLIGSNRWFFRLVLAAPAAAAGFVAGAKLAGHYQLSSAQLAAGAGAAVLAAGALAYPPVVLGLALGGLGALLGADVAGEDNRLLGLIPGALLAGVLGLAFWRIAAAAVSALFGAVMLALGGLTLLSVTRFGGIAGNHPTAALAGVGLLALAGLAFQLKFVALHEADPKKRAAKLRAKELARDAKERDKRFSNYGKVR